MPPVSITKPTLIAVFVLLAVEATAANVPEVPGDEIFGFSTPTDVGNAGDTGFANENDGRVGKRGGSYRALNTRYEFGYTFAPDWWIGVSLFGAYNYARNVPDLIDVNRPAFDGVSFELERRIVKRSATNPFAVAVSVEPRWGGIESITGLTAHSINVAFKLFVDAVVIPDKLYWGFNAIWTPQRSEDPTAGNKWISSSGALISSALAYQISPTFFVGLEARYLGSFSSILPTQDVGHALYAGPTLLWKITDKLAFNTTLQPQIAGRSAAHPDRRLDLDNFERAQFRAKFSVGLP
jgi:hypothetical protein